MLNDSVQEEIEIFLQSRAEDGEAPDEGPASQVPLGKRKPQGDPPAGRKSKTLKSTLPPKAEGDTVLHWTAHKGCMTCLLASVHFLLSLAWPWTEVILLQIDSI